MKLTIDVAEGEQIYIKRMKDKNTKKSNKFAEKFVKEFLTPPPEPPKSEEEINLDALVENMQKELNDAGYGDHQLVAHPIGLPARFKSF